jgi:benzoyl-CoA-dihydrodiol lyase
MGKACHDFTGLLRRTLSRLKGEPVGPIAFATDPSRYRHWDLAVDGPIATLTMRVAPDGGLSDGYELKLNSYDLGVDIELYDASQRLRFEHPEVKAVVVTGVEPGLGGAQGTRVFCSGANIQMLAGATHGHKVNFCKFTNETRNAIEDATANSGQTWIAAVNGSAAGGGYELALACDEIVLVDDRSSSVSLPEVPLLAVLPGTGGLTRLVDKRHVRRDLADVFATRAEGVRGQQAVEWGLVDAVAPRSRFEAVVRERAMARAERSLRPGGAGVMLTPLEAEVGDDSLRYEWVTVTIDRVLGVADLTVRAPGGDHPTTADGLLAAGAEAWVLAAARQLDDAVLRLRFNEPEIGAWVLRAEGDPGAVDTVDELLHEGAEHWLVNEVRCYWTRVLKRLDLSARTIVALIGPGSCFSGLLAELALVADRSFMLDGPDPEGRFAEATLRLTAANDGWFPMANGLSRLESRFWGRPGELEDVRSRLGKDLHAAEAVAAGLVTFTPDELDWDDEIRLTLEERTSFSPDALTGMEANLRFAGPETMETKIFGRLTAWQNWIFQRPNAVGPEGALRRFGTGSRPVYDRARV